MMFKPGQIWISNGHNIVTFVIQRQFSTASGNCLVPIELSCRQNIRGAIASLGIQNDFSDSEDFYLRPYRQKANDNLVLICENALIPDSQKPFWHENNRSFRGNSFTEYQKDMRLVSEGGRWLQVPEEWESLLPEQHPSSTYLGLQMHPSRLQIGATYREKGSKSSVKLLKVELYSGRHGAEYRVSLENKDPVKLSVFIHHYMFCAPAPEAPIEPVITVKPPQSIQTAKQYDQKQKTFSTFRNDQKPVSALRW